MLRSVKQLHGHAIEATDGEIGSVREMYFDDEKWTVRYIVVETGKWLIGRKVLLSPESFRRPLAADGGLAVELTREQVKNSPDIATHRPISRQQETELLAYYGYAPYWGMGGLAAVDMIPTLPAVSPIPPHMGVAPTGSGVSEDSKVRAEDSHLRGSAEVSGYSIEAQDGSLGHVEDFLFGDDEWTIHYLVVDTRNWWPGGRKVLVATRWIDAIDWPERKVMVTLDRDEIKRSPEYRENGPISREDEEALHRLHGRSGYWI